MSERDAARATFGERLRVARQERGWTLAAVAGQVGHSIAYVSDIERGKRTPRTAAATNLGRLLGVVPDVPEVERLRAENAALRERLAALDVVAHAAGEMADWLPGVTLTHEQYRDLLANLDTAEAERDALREALGEAVADWNTLDSQPPDRAWCRFCREQTHDWRNHAELCPLRVWHETQDAR
jgi:transcriptional regulator with XRE-family HTH domain